MPGFDNLLSDEFKSQIKYNLGKSYWSKIQNNVFNKTGYTVLECIQLDYDMFNDVLVENFGKTCARHMQKSCLENILQEKKIQTKNPDRIFKIISSSIKNTIMKAYGQSDKLCILQSLTETPNHLMHVLKTQKFSQTSFYRTVNELVDAGLLIKTNNNNSIGGRQVNSYQTLFSKVSISVNVNEIHVAASLSPTTASYSKMLRVLG